MSKKASEIFDKPSPEWVNVVKNEIDEKNLFEKHPLFDLLTHPDSDGYINYGKCGKIADELEKLLPLLEKEEDQGGHIGNWKAKTETFITGLRLAAKNKERLQFR